MMQPVGKEHGYSGGQAAIETFHYVCGPNLASLRVTYYAESAGDQLIFAKSPSGYEVTMGYSHELFYCGPRLILASSAYDFDAGQPAKQRGWYLGASVMLAQGLLTLKATAGYDSVILNNYTVGADVRLPF